MERYRCSITYLLGLVLPRGSGESYSSSCRRSLRGIALEAQTRISPCTLWGASVTHGSTFLPERLIGRERVSIPFTERGTGMGRGSGKSVNCRAAARQMGDIGIGRHQEHQFSPTVGGPPLRRAHHPQETFKILEGAHTRMKPSSRL